MSLAGYTRIEPDPCRSWTVPDSSAGPDRTRPTDQRITVTEREPFWEPDGSIGTEHRWTHSGEVAKVRAWPSTWRTRLGRQIKTYGSEGWGFESLRAVLDLRAVIVMSRVMCDR
jgi:hypothetical protein